jgi:small subunit ribosomal protein S17
MTEEEKTDAEETQDAPQEEVPEEAEAADEPAIEEAAPEEAPDPSEAAPEDAPAPEEEAADEPAAEEAADEPAAEETADEPAAAAPAGDEEPEAPLTPKQLRKQARSRHTGETRPARTPEERAAERADLRANRVGERRRSRARARSKRQPGQGTPPAERRPGAQKVRRGRVVSDKADKTITVQIEITRRHPVYEKVVRRSTTIHAHDERNEASAGDVVRVIESRPMSRTKRWRLVEVLERAR